MDTNVMIRKQCVAGARGRAPHGDSAVRSVTDAHCIVSTHYFLLPSPYSLLKSHSRSSSWSLATYFASICAIFLKSAIGQFTFLIVNCALTPESALG